MSEDTPPVSTGSGDDGTTTLLGGGRQAKDDERIALLGDIDEASSSLGLARAEAEDKEIEDSSWSFSGSCMALWVMWGCLRNRTRSTTRM